MCKKMRTEDYLGIKSLVQFAIKTVTKPILGDIFTEEIRKFPNENTKREDDGNKNNYRLMSLPTDEHSLKRMPEAEVQKN
jgi:hypothetical protein